MGVWEASEGVVLGIGNSAGDQDRVQRAHQARGVQRGPAQGLDAGDPDAPLGYHQARKAQWSADVLLLVEASQPWASEIIPGKFFEYLETQKPILALGPDRWDVHQILSQTDSGFYAESTDVTRIKSLIRKLWQHHRDGQPATRPTGIDGYTRQNRTHQLATLLHEFTL